MRGGAGSGRDPADRARSAARADRRGQCARDPGAAGRGAAEPAGPAPQHRGRPAGTAVPSGAADRAAAARSASREVALEEGVPEERIEMIGPITLTRAPLPRGRARSPGRGVVGASARLAVGVTEAEGRRDRGASDRSALLPLDADCPARRSGAGAARRTACPGRGLWCATGVRRPDRGGQCLSCR